MRSMSAPSPQPSARSTATRPFANGCLLARRLVERGVRTVHVYYGPGQPWDDHSRINKNLAPALPGHGPGVRRADLAT